jgi:DNA-binding HxlR family transcriptional regulator
VARALDLVGERWALLVVRELLLGPKRFSGLVRGLPAVSQNVLSQRLRELERDGVLRRCRTGPPASTRGYELTERGQQLAPVLIELGRWGSAGAQTSTAELGVDALVLALRTRFQPAHAVGLLAWVELVLDPDRFALTVADERFTVRRGGLDDPDAVLRTDPGTLRELAFRGRPLDEMIAAGRATVTGNRRAAVRVLGCFLPAPTE